MLLPIRTSIRSRRTPYVNYALIVVNIVAFILTYSPHRTTFGQVEILRDWAVQYMLDPSYPHLWQFVTYAFLHANLMHIFGNMYFLYIFGEGVNDKLGHLAYFCFYLAGAVFAAIGHILFNMNPVLGASGAVAAVTGAYLVLFPRTVITVLYWFFFYIGTIDLSALFFIAFKLIFWDNMLQPGLAPRSVAYGAHLAGYVFGIAACLLLLTFGLIARSQTDLWYMLRQWNRRRRFRETVADGYNPYTGVGGSKWIKVHVKDSPEISRRRREITHLRAQIAEFVSHRNLGGAAETYARLLDLEPDHVLPRPHQLDIANQFMSMGRWEKAAQAYELLIRNYPGFDSIEQIHLMLGILYSRYLQDNEKARHYLELAQEHLTDPGQKNMCRDEINKLRD